MIKFILVDKPKGMYLLDEANKMAITVFKWNGVDVG
jgi:hypothetical protein